MQILWSAQAPLTARQILQQLGDRRTWALPWMTALACLGEKGFVRCDRSTRTNLYTPTPLPRSTRPRRANPFWHGCIKFLCPAWWPASTTVAIGKAELQELRDYLIIWRRMRMLNLLFTSVLELSSPQVWSWRFSWPFPRFRQSRLASLALPALDSAGPSAAAAVLLPGQDALVHLPLPTQAVSRTGCFTPSAPASDQTS